MRKIDPDIPAAIFPSQFVSDKEKESAAFGLKVGQAIQYQWFRRDSNTYGQYYSRWREYHRLRKYAMGLQSVQKYKDELAIDGDLSYLNLDWTPVPIIPKFIDIVVNGMQDRLFSVKAYAQDAMSAEKRTSYQDMIEGQMVAKDLMTNVESEFGINAFTMDPVDLPASDEELELHMQLNYKPAIEIAEEEAISTVLAENKYEETRKRVDYDLVTLGVGFAKHQFLPGAGIVIDWVDPANVVHSYTEDPFHRDCFYWGEIKTLPLTELKKIDTSLTNSDLEEISKYSSSWYDYFNVAQFYDNDMFFKDTATIMYFSYKTTKKFVYKKKKYNSGASKVSQRDDSFNPPMEMMEEGNFEKIEKTIDVWYSGVMVMGTNIILKWELEENMVRPKSASQHAMPMYVGCAPRLYKGTIESLLGRMIPFADLIQMTHLKLQQVVARIVPDGIYIDADGLTEIDLGNGKKYTPQEALRLYFQTGSVIGRSYTQDGEYNHSKVPVQELQHSAGQAKMQALIGNYNHYLDMIRGVTGLNEARDGSDPDPYSLVGVQKLAALNSNTATRHILEASHYILRTVSEGVSCRVSDVLEYSDHAEKFANQIGKYNVSILREIKDLYLYDFGIFLEVSPDAEQREQLEQNIQAALAKENINLEDAIDIREIKNIKQANQLLKIKRKRKEEKDLQNQMMLQQQQQQAQMAIQQVQAQTQAQKVQMETAGKIQVEEAKAMTLIAVQNNEANKKKELMREEFLYNMQLKGIEVEDNRGKEEMKEKGKADRISQQNSQMSQLIEQRNRDLPAKNFESNEDTLDGFDLAQFEPR